MRLRHLHADRAAADDDEMLGAFLVREDGFVRVKGHLVETGNLRNEGPRAGGDDEASRRNLRITRDHGIAVAEARMILDDGDAEALEAGNGIVRRNGGDDAVDVVVNLGEIDLRFRGRDAERSRRRPCGRPASRRRAAPSRARSPCSGSRHPWRRARSAPFARPSAQHPPRPKDRPIPLRSRRCQP